MRTIAATLSILAGAVAGLALPSCESPCWDSASCGPYDGPLPNCDGTWHDVDGGTCDICPKRGSDGVWRYPDGQVWQEANLQGDCTDAGAGSAGVGGSGGTSSGAGSGGTSSGAGSGGSGGASRGGTNGKGGSAGEVSAGGQSGNGGSAQCLTHADCMDATASRCASGTCAPCSGSADCSHIGGLTVCDVLGAECVECTTLDEASCGGNSCNPATRECTSTPRASVTLCRPCLADSECIGGDQADPSSRCVPMAFQGMPRPGGFCMRRAEKLCAQPFTVIFSARSLSGAASESYCGIDQNDVRCEAVRDHLDARSCPGGSDDLCGCARDTDGNCTEAGQGGLCDTVGGIAERCTYSCDNALQCGPLRTCSGTPGVCE